MTGIISRERGSDHNAAYWILGSASWLVLVFLAWSTLCLLMDEAALDALVVRRRQVRMLGKWESWTLLLLWFEWKCSPVWKRWAVRCSDELRDGRLECEVAQYCEQQYCDWSEQ